MYSRGSVREEDGWWMYAEKISTVVGGWVDVPIEDQFPVFGPVETVKPNGESGPMW